MIKISVYYEDNLVTELEQAEERDISIGRAAGCSIHLDEPSISRLHAVIRAQSGQWLLERKANFGAVLLNGQEVENAPLEGGEEISVGKFILRVNIEASRASVPSVSSASLGAAGDDDDDGGGRTRFVSASSGGLFRFEPGGANVAEYSLDQPVAVFGRGSNCDVVLSEKKASRKHFEVRRQGLSFFLKDLNSANGTFVNDQRVEGEVELVPGDVVKVGESAIQFSVENKDFFRAQDQFLPVPAHLQEAATVEPGGYVPGAESFGAFPAHADPALASEPPPPEEPPLSSTDLLGRAKRAWFKIPKAQRMRYLTIMVVACLVMALLGSPDEPKPKKAPVKAGSAAARSYDNLTKKMQTLVRTKYAELLKAQEKKDYVGMKELAGQILVYVDDYKDTKDYETMAAKAIDKIESDKKERELQAQIEKRRTEVKALEDKGEVILAKVLADRRFRSELDALIQEVYAKDPSNNKVKVWLTKIKDKDEEERRLAEEAQKREELKSRAEGALEAVRATFTAGRYIPALQEAATLADIPWEEDGYRERVEALKNEIRGKLSSIIDPLLRDAGSQRGEGGDLVRARDLYNEVLKTDASNKEALDGLEAIYEVLHMRAKRLYAEAILAESVSDLTEAKDRFEKCLRAAPEKSIYRKRCRSKLARFESFGNIPGVGGSSGGGF